ncbi:MAG: hypothetical protein IPM26_08940 [Saprospiraceae bacterium]|nr:hypothetical protein [Saprospiraceae bacterium]
MLKDKNIFTNNFAFELKLNPHPTLEKDYTCIITTRNKYVPKGDESKDAKRRNPFIQFLSRLNKNGELNKIFNTLKSSSPAFIDWALNSFVEDTYIDKSFKVFNIGEANYIPAYSSELAISMKDDQYIEIIDKLLEHIEFIRKKNNWYMSGPLAIRFVRKANAWISPMYGEDTCMVEVIMAKGTLHAKKIYTSIEKEMDKYNVRMHWGQYNYQSSAMIQRKYPKIEKWKKVAAELNKTNVFTNNYINSVGLNS